MSTIEERTCLICGELAETNIDPYVCSDCSGDRSAIGERIVAMQAVIEAARKLSKSWQNRTYIQELAAALAKLDGTK